MTVNIAMLILSLALLLLIQLVQAQHTVNLHGVAYALSSRDKPVDVGVFGGRMQRAKVNLLENMMLFAPVSVLAEALHLTGATITWGAVLFFAARVVHLVTYLAGVAVVRTLSWFVGVIGCALLALAEIGWIG